MKIRVLPKLGRARVRARALGRIQEGPVPKSQEGAALVMGREWPPVTPCSFSAAWQHGQHLLAHISSSIILEKFYAEFTGKEDVAVRHKDHIIAFYSSH